ncbi:MAG: IS982 family transposase, partial [Alistipes sp.]
IDGGEDLFIIDSKPLPVCRNARASRSKMGKKNDRLAPNFGYCATQKQYYYGYKMHLTSGLRGVIRTFEFSPASVADIHYLQDVKFEIPNSTIIADRAYLSATVQLDLFQRANIRLEVPYRHNQKDFRPVYKPFAKARKRIETTFSQLSDQFMMIRNYAKNFAGFSTRILAKITAFTILQYLNFTQDKPLCKTKYALC